MSSVLAPLVLAATTAGTALSVLYEVIHIATKSSGVTSFDIFTMKFPVFGVLLISVLLYSLCLFLIKATIQSNSCHAAEALSSTSRSIVDPIVQAVSSRSSKRRHRRRKRQQLGLLSMLQHSSSTDSKRNDEDDDVSDEEEASSAASLLPFSLSLSSASITKLWEDIFLSPESAMKTPFRILKPEEEDEIFFAEDSASFDDGTEPDDDKHADNHSPVHFCFLVHGFRGHSRDLSYVQAVMRRCASLQKSTRQLVVHSSRCNEKKTDDGVIAGGTRLFHEMLNVIRTEMSSRTKDTTESRNPKILKPISISLWGNSLGGLYARYALSLLSEHFVVSNNAADGSTYWIVDNAYVVHLNIFCTTATPHLGISGHTFVTLPRRAEIGLASAMGTTGKDLFRINSILYDMATSEQFVNPLSLFRKRVCYANAYGTDFPVPASTAAFLSECSTYPHRVSDDDDPNDDSLVQIATLFTAPLNRSDENTLLHIQNKEEASASLDKELARMSISLDSLGWKKVFVDMRKEVPHIVLPKSLIRGGSGSKSMFATKTTTSTTPVQSMTSSTQSERSSHGSNSSDEEDDDTATLHANASASKLDSEKSTYPIEPIHRMVKKRRISSRQNSTSKNLEYATMVLSSKDVAAAVSTSALLFDTNTNTEKDSTNNDNTQNDERDERNDGKDGQDETHFAIHWPLGHNMIVAFSRSRWSAHMNKAGRPVVDALAKEIVNDILAFQPTAIDDVTRNPMLQ